MCEKLLTEREKRISFRITIGFGPIRGGREASQRGRGIDQTSTTRPGVGRVRLIGCSPLFFVGREYECEHCAPDHGLPAAGGRLLPRSDHPALQGLAVQEIGNYRFGRGTDCHTEHSSPASNLDARSSRMVASASRTRSNTCRASKTGGHRVRNADMIIGGRAIFGATCGFTRLV